MLLGSQLGPSLAKHLAASASCSWIQVFPVDGLASLAQSFWFHTWSL